MVKILLLAGIVGMGGFIGTLGVSQVMGRRDVLRELQQDMRTIENLLVQQRMTVCGALQAAAHGSRMDAVYRRLAGEIKGACAAEEILENSGILKNTPIGELAAREREMIKEYFIKLLECVSAEEISLATERFYAEAERLLRALESRELQRAKTLRSVWVLAGMGVAVILI